MALGDYQSKRNFHQTPEPKGQTKPSAGPLQFVVQKHVASHLHYDFRLEIDGVLKSWAIPKGPSLDPEDKRLAMMTEDHPMDYRTFEGIIPKGNYGAGTVMVWDEGNYTERTTADPIQSQQNLRHGLHAGHITFILNGQKLKGEFALIKLKNAEDKAWLLVKKDDQYATKTDILKRDRSVLSRRTMNQIAKDPAVWQSNHSLETELTGAPKAALPTRIKPMLATLVEQPFDDDDWVFEVKWDGYRMIALAESGQVKLQSRGGQDYSEVFQPITDQIATLGHRAVLDGEIVVVDAEGRSHFQDLQNYQRTKEGNLQYFVFDLLYLDGHDLKSLSLLKRKELLKDLLDELDSSHQLINYSDHLEGLGRDFFALAKAKGLEGIVAKRKLSPYQEGRRGADWLKIKAAREQEVVIAGWTEPRGSRKHIGALILGLYDGDELRYIGHTAGRLGEQDLADLHQVLKKLEVPKAPFATIPQTNAPAHWVRPKLVAQVAFSEWTQEGHMRQPIFLGLRNDKAPGEVKMEAPAKGDMNIKTKASLSNLDKVYWPDEGFTKGDLIVYYDQIAEVILPYLKDRPESLHRYPHGIKGESFYQKNLEQVPSWAKTLPIESGGEDRTIHYLLANDRDTLLYMANLGCIEINPWHSRLKKLDSPDYCVIDLDPEDISFEAVIQTAQQVHRTLDELGVPSYPKTSGATGMHIYIPLGAKYNYDQSLKFALLVVNLVHQKLPGLTSLERSPAKRQQRVYLDYLQNPRGQTLASVYSVRPRPGATVSAPLKWSEVKKGLTPAKFTIKTMAKRLDKVGDLWSPVLGKGIDIKKIIKQIEQSSS
jgi:bifunctional non-homologous end joining protein LigD